MPVNLQQAGEVLATEARRLLRPTTHYPDPTPGCGCSAPLWKFRFRSFVRRIGDPASDQIVHRASRNGSDGLATVTSTRVLCRQRAQGIAGLWTQSDELNQRGPLAQTESSLQPAVVRLCLILTQAALLLILRASRRKMGSMTLSKLAIALQLLLVPAAVSPQDQPRASVTGILTAFGDEVTILEQTVVGARSETIRGIRFITGDLRGRRVVIASSGVGKVHAALSATLLIDHFKPSEVLFSGIAGGINPDLHPGDIVIGQRAAQHDLGTLTPQGIVRRGVRNPVDWQPSPLFLDADPRLCAQALAAAGSLEFEKIETSEGLRTPKVIPGLIVTGDVFVASPSKKKELREELGADAVEMEGAAVAQVCHLLRVPWLVIRSISDVADADASRDMARFYSVAAQNSTRLVMEIVAGLAKP